MIGLCLAVATVTVFWPVKNHDFVNYDDQIYVFANPHLINGITFEGIRWAFTATRAGNWHPLTWISHLTDYGLYGLEAGGHHLTSLFLHVVNALLLFWILTRMTGGLWQSAFVAALFAIHPLHVGVRSVGVERKDVLSTLFWILTMAAYVRYVERPGLPRYLLVVLFFVLGLMTKPMLVTLPFRPSPS